MLYLGVVKDRLTLWKKVVIVPQLAMWLCVMYYPKLPLFCAPYSRVFGSFVQNSKIVSLKNPGCRHPYGGQYQYRTLLALLRNGAIPTIRDAEGNHVLDYVRRRHLQDKVEIEKFLEPFFNWSHHWIITDNTLPYPGIHWIKSTQKKNIVTLSWFIKYMFLYVQ